jgi:RNA-directed DNA polymerase
VDVSEMQRKLSQWATDDPTKRFVDLYSLLCNEVWLRVAAHDTLRNRGSQTAGIDGMTKSNFLGDEEGNINRLRERLKAQTFEPMPVRRVYISLFGKPTHRTFRRRLPMGDRRRQSKLL